MPVNEREQSQSQYLNFHFFVRHNLFDFTIAKFKFYFWHLHMIKVTL